MNNCHNSVLINIFACLEQDQKYKGNQRSLCLTQKTALWTWYLITQYVIHIITQIHIVNNKHSAYTDDCLWVCDAFIPVLSFIMHHKVKLFHE